MHLRKLSVINFFGIKRWASLQPDAQRFKNCRKNSPKCPKKTLLFQFYIYRCNFIQMVALKTDFFSIICPGFIDNKGFISSFVVLFMKVYYLVIAYMTRGNSIKAYTLILSYLLISGKLDICIAVKDFFLNK